jgi:hypothetical protein
MREYVFVEFLALKPTDSKLLLEKLCALGEDFLFLKAVNELEEDEDGHSSEWFRIDGKISSAYATAIKLKDPFLSERMRVSHIPDELKDRYRQTR